MRHGDAFCGIGGFGLAARRVGWSTVWAAEIEPSARAIYSARLGHDGLRFDSDIRESRDLPPIDVLTGGFPCQDVSVAGKRAGLKHADGSSTRSGLFFELARILAESRPEWFVFENVPGLLSHDRGRTMGIVLSTLVELGYGVAWRVLNAQFFGVAQRRRRVFIVGHSSGDERRAAAVLFERAGLSRNPPEEREAGKDIAGTLGSSTGGGFRTTDLDQSGAFIVAHSLRAEGFDASEDGTGRGTPLVIAPTLRCGGMADGKHAAGSSYDNTPIVPIDLRQTSRGDKLTNNRRDGTSGGPPGIGIGSPGDPAFTVSERGQAIAFNWQAGGSKDFIGGKNDFTDALGRCQTPAVAYTLRSNERNNSNPGCANYITGPSPDPARVRTATGLPGSLDVCPFCELGPDSPRYRGLGNAVAVPVVLWILRRIEMSALIQAKEIA